MIEAIVLSIITASTAMLLAALGGTDAAPEPADPTLPEAPVPADATSLARFLAAPASEGGVGLADPERRLARAVDDPALSDDVLQQTRAWVDAGINQVAVT